MSKFAARVSLLIVIFTPSHKAPCQAALPPAGPALNFSLSREGEPPIAYSIRVEEITGNGLYQKDLGSPQTGTPKPGSPVPIHLDSPTVKKLFAAVPVVKGGHCESHAKNIAKTGIKVLRYDNGTEHANCSYNYSNEDRVNDATNLFEAIAFTMQFGDSLAAKLRFDRLGLDAELDALQTAVNEHQAIEVQNIAPVLQSIAGDERAMDRVRRKATRLLESAGTPVSQGFGEPSSSPR